MASTSKRVRLDFEDVLDIINDSDADSSCGGMSSDEEGALDEGLEVSDHEIE